MYCNFDEEFYIILDFPHFLKFKPKYAFLASVSDYFVCLIVILFNKEFKAKIFLF